MLIILSKIEKYYKNWVGNDINIENLLNSKHENIELLKNQIKWIKNIFKLISIISLKIIRKKRLNYKYTIHELHKQLRDTYTAILILY